MERFTEVSVPSRGTGFLMRRVFVIESLKGVKVSFRPLTGNGIFNLSMYLLVV